MKKRWLILGILVVLIAGALAFACSGLSAGQRLPLQGINLADVADGEYAGTYSAGRWTNTVNVHVRDHQITAIDMVDDVGAAFITNCSDEVFQRVIAAQNTQIDAVSGATVTSKAYLKAIENALNR